MTINDFKDEVIPCTNFNFEFSFLSCIENDSLCDGNQENLVFSFQRTMGEMGESLATNAK